MRLVFAVVAALVVIALALFSLYKCGPMDELGGGAGAAGGSTRAADGSGTLESNLNEAAIYDDVDLVPLPDYATVRLPAAQRQLLTADAQNYIDELAQPKADAVDVSSAAGFVGGEQTIIVDGVALTVDELLDPETRSQLIAQINAKKAKDDSDSANTDSAGFTGTDSTGAEAGSARSGSAGSGSANINARQEVGGTDAIDSTGNAQSSAELAGQNTNASISGSSPESTSGSGSSNLNRRAANSMANSAAKAKGKKRQSLYYIHTVAPTDEQGIWGILQSGLKEKFANGLAIKRDEQDQVYRVIIPDTADEQDGANSSFLGRVLHQKVRDSMVYNRQNGKVGRNPNVIFPGQQLVIVEFKREELLSIYEYFITQTP